MIERKTTVVVVCDGCGAQQQVDGSTVQVPGWGVHDLVQYCSVCALVVANWPSGVEFTGPYDAPRPGFVWVLAETLVPGLRTRRGQVDTVRTTKWYVHWRVSGRRSEHRFHRTERVPVTLSSLVEVVRIEVPGAAEVTWVVSERLRNDADVAFERLCAWVGDDPSVVSLVA